MWDGKRNGGTTILAGENKNVIALKTRLLTEEKEAGDGGISPPPIRT